MAKTRGPQTQLVRWTDATLGDDIGDPLGLELRVAGRLLSQLLHCITSVTPRARYFSFLSWCILDYRQRQRGTPSDRGMTDAIRQREKCLALGCVALHEGDSCEDGGVVGSREAQRRDNQGESNVVLDKYRIDGSMAWNQYFGSMRNLGLFALEATPKSADDDERQATIDDLDLSEVGHRLAEAYGQAVGASGHLDLSRPVTISRLAEFAEKGGLCEIQLPIAVDQSLLRDVFFNKVQSPGESHRFRRQSLLLLMEYMQRLGAEGIPLKERTFADLVYFDQTNKGNEVLVVTVPEMLADIRTRWRMFYFHYYAALALEGMFKAVVGMAFDAGRAGVSIRAIADELNDPAVLRRVGDSMGMPIGGSLLGSSMQDLLTSCGLSDAGEGLASLSSPVSEPKLADHVRRWDSGTNAGGFAASYLLLSLSLIRYRSMHETRYGAWLANNVRDPHLDLAPPVLVRWLERRHANWRVRPIGEYLADFVNRFVVQQHEWLGFEKGTSSTKIILHGLDERLVATDRWDTLGVGNARFSNARQTLKDLGLAAEGEEKVWSLTPLGRTWLGSEMSKEAAV